MSVTGVRLITKNEQRTMKKTLRIAFAIAILLAGVSQTLLAQTDYYWNSGIQPTPSWHVAGNWRTGSVNGTVSTSVPTSADNVHFSTASFTIAPTTTVAIIVSQASA